VPLNVLLERREVAFYLSDPDADCCWPGMSSRRRRPTGQRRRARTASSCGRASSSVCSRGPTRQTCALNVAVAARACLTLIPRFRPDKVLEIIQRDRVNVFEGVPTMYIALLNRSEAASYVGVNIVPP
jgi:hypothetical protein